MPRAARRALRPDFHPAQSVLSRGPTGFAVQRGAGGPSKARIVEESIHMKATGFRYRCAVLALLLVLSLTALGIAPAVLAQTPAAPQPAAPAASQAQTSPTPPPSARVQHAGGEASLKLPDLGQASFIGINGRTLLMAGLVICVLGLVFGLVIYQQLKALPVHRSMLEISELIYETCKTYLINQGKFLLILEVFIGIIMAFYFGVLRHFEAMQVVIILLFSLIGIAGSYGVAWFGIRINTFANSRTAFASLEGKPYPVYAIPIKAGMSIGMALVSVELFMMLCILLFI